MIYQTLIVEEFAHGITITLNRLIQKNTLNNQMMLELHSVLNEAENNPNFHIIVLRGQQGVFCTGMDFKEIVETKIDKSSSNSFALTYMSLLKSFALSTKIIISCIDGQVMAGGIGIVAASDLVIATPKSQFNLSEVLWGLLPANVLPYLIRRIGFQKSYVMTLTTQTIQAPEAHSIHLVDELSEQPEETIRKLTLRLSRLDTQTIRDLKNYFRKLWIIDEKIEELAANELSRLIQEPRVINNIKRFIEKGQFPWETQND